MYFNLIRIAILALAVCASAAYADGPAITVSSRGLDLNSRSDAQAMVHRIEQAASTVCGGDPWKARYTANTKAELREYRKCMTATVAEAVAQLRSPGLVRAAIAPRQIAARD